MSGILDYATDGETWVGLSDAVITPGTTAGAGTYSAVISGGLPAGVWNIYVRNHTDTAQVGETSAPFAVTAASPVALPTIANHILSLEPDNGFGYLFTDTALSIQATIGQGIESVGDNSGSGNSWIYNGLLTPVAAAPVFVSDIKNALPALQFSATNPTYLRLGTNMPIGPALQAAATATSGAGFTIAAFFTLTTLPAAGSYFEIFQILSNVAGVTQPYRVRLYVAGGGVITARLGDDSNGASAQVSAPAAVAVNTTVSVVLGYDGTNFDMTVGAQEEQSAAPSTKVWVQTWDDGWMGADRVGNTASNIFFGGNLLGLEMWTTPYTQANATALVAYGTSKWGA